MTRAHPQQECTRTDAVLARHLDGALDDGGQPGDGYAFVSADLLHEHLRACAVCQTALRRARRLDAALAQATGRDLAAHAQRRGASLPELQSRWFAAVADRCTRSRATDRIAAEATRPVVAASPTPTHHRLPRALTAPFAALAAGLLALVVLRPQPTPPAAMATATVAMADAVAPAEVTLSTVTLPAVTLPADAWLQWQKRRGTTAPGQRTIEQRAQRSAPTLCELQGRVADAQLDARDRLGSARQLLAAAAPLGGHNRGALVALVEAMASHGDLTPAARQLHGELLDLLRATPHVLGAMQAHLHTLAGAEPRIDRSDLAFVLVAARLGVPALDAALRRLVRRHHDLAPCIAAALRGAERPHPATLLLDLWHDLAARGAVADDEHTAAAWFTGQGAAMFADLAAELRSSRDGARRLRCLLALGCAGDASSLPTLLERLDSTHVDEALTAAFAIACLPRHVLQPLVTMAARPDAYLLRAALVRADLPATRHWQAGFGSPAHDLPRADLARFLAEAMALRDPGGLAD